MNPEMSDTEDYVMGHHGRCAVVLIKLFPKHSHELLKAMVTHDCAESVVGDLAYPFKKAGGDVVKAHQELETEVLKKIGLYYALTHEEKLQRDLIDYLDSYLYVKMKKPWKVKQKAWKAMRQDILDKAHYLGVREKVKKMINDV